MSIHVPAATLHEAAGRVGALPSALSPLSPSMRLWGTAFPVLSPAGDNLWLHRALAAADVGEVLVVAFDDPAAAREHGHWGEVMTVAAQAQGLVGLVIDGGVRDRDQLIARGFPVFSSSVCLRGTGKDPAGRGSLAQPVMIGSTTIQRGDLVAGDADGVVVIPAQDVQRAVAEAVRREESEAEIFRRLAIGETTLDIYGLPGVAS